MSMMLQDWTNVFQIAGSIGSVAVAVLVYIWQRRSTRAQSAAVFAEQIRHYNLLVLQDEKLQAFEAERHPYGLRKGSPEFTIQDVQKMYRFFILLNVGHAQYVAKRSGALDDSAYEATIGNSANMTYDDREFIRIHCFPRGYPAAFREEYERRWKARESNGGVPTPH